MTWLDRTTFGGIFAGRSRSPLVVGEAQEILVQLRRVRQNASASELPGLDVAIAHVEQLDARTDDERIAAWLRRRLADDVSELDRVQLTKIIRDEFPDLGLRDAVQLADLVLDD